MSFSHTNLAAPVTPGALQDAFLAAWPTFVLAEPAQAFATWDDALHWADARCEYMSGRHPDDVKFIYPDGAWAVLSDVSMCMASDEQSLMELSRRTLRVVVGSTQGTVGFAQLQVFEAGSLVRRLTGVDGRTTAEGTPLPEEAGLDVSHFYLDELDAIWCRLGLTSFIQGAPTTAPVGLHVLDQTEYPPAVAQAIASVRPGKPAQATPWWRFW